MKAMKKKQQRQLVIPNLIW